MDKKILCCLDSFVIFPQVVGGNIAVPLNDLENKWMYDVTKGRAGHCSRYLGTNYLWIGATDNNVEGRWDNWDTNVSLTYQGAWRGGGPNGGKVENCLVMLHGSEFSGLWSDIACLDSYSFCVACEFKAYSTLYLRGGLLCRNSPFNNKYLLYKDINGKIALTGFRHTDIYWINDTSTWILQSRKVLSNMLLD